MGNTSFYIFYGVDRSFVIPFTVSLTSLLENNENIDITVYVIHNIEDTGLLHELSFFFKKKYNTKVIFKFFRRKTTNKLPISEQISEAAYFRLFLGEMIPDKISSGLYLDCDTVITGSLKELMGLNFSSNLGIEYELLAVSDKNEINEAKRLTQLGFKTQYYFNSGVMLINLRKWRTKDLTKRFVQLALKNIADLKWHDQDVLNMLCVNKWGKLKATYNKTANKIYSEVPVVIHFSGGSKPWHYIDNGPYKSFYLKYLKLTPFKDKKGEHINAGKVYRKYVNLFKSNLGIKSFSHFFLSPFQRSDK